MNERIKELYNKAWLKVDPRNPQETFTQAFAELIIKETLEVARAGIEFGPSMDEAVYTYFGLKDE